jgi:PRTRC genetic system protein C
MANTRIFIIDNREFPDPDPNMTVEEVRQYYVTYFAELSNAETKESHRPDPAWIQSLIAGGMTAEAAAEQAKTDKEHVQDVYEFKKRVGTKGHDDAPEGPRPFNFPEHRVASGPQKCPKCDTEVAVPSYFDPCVNAASRSRCG